MSRRTRTDVLVLLASRFDEPAAWLAERWKDRGACLLTCEGLSLRGWRHESAVPERSLAVLDGKTVPVGEIRGVLTRLTCVSEAELPHIVPAERAYVAAEMHAFLLAWLSSLRCPVQNRPTPLNLTGPGWRDEQWICEAARVGLPIRALRRVAKSFAAGLASGSGSPELPAKSDACFDITVVGSRCLLEGPDPPAEALADGARRLAEAAGVELMTARFISAGGATLFVGASPWVDLARSDIAGALLAQWEAQR